MENYIICPCCGKELSVLCEDGKIAVFFVAQNQDKLQEKLSLYGVELGIVKGGGLVE